MRRPAPAQWRTPSMRCEAQARIPADVSTGDGMAAVAQAVGKRQLDILIHAAGRESVTPFATATRAELDAVLANQPHGPVLPDPEARPALRRTRERRFVLHR